MARMGSSRCEGAWGHRHGVVRLLQYVYLYEYGKFVRICCIRRLHAQQQNARVAQDAGTCYSSHVSSSGCLCDIMVVNGWLGWERYG